MLATNRPSSFNLCQWHTLCRKIYLHVTDVLLNVGPQAASNGVIIYDARWRIYGEFTGSYPLRNESFPLLNDSWVIHLFGFKKFSMNIAMMDCTHRNAGDVLKFYEAQRNNRSTLYVLWSKSETI